MKFLLPGRPLYFGHEPLRQRRIRAGGPRRREGGALLGRSGLLAGIVDDLRDHNTRLCLVSHRSGQPSIGKTQRQLLKALDTRYPGRVRPYRFDCHSRTGERAAEETQRTRFFLYTVIAFVLARNMGKHEITVFENGVTSLNLPKRQDMMHGRASRTTHPRPSPCCLGSSAW